MIVYTKGNLLKEILHIGESAYLKMRAEKKFGMSEYESKILAGY